MRREDVRKLCLAEEAAFAAGEDFARVTQGGRIETDWTAWDFDEIARARLREAKAFVDMENGSSELLRTLRRLPFHAFATQSDPKKLDSMRLRLSSLGFRVSAVQNPADVPFEEENIDLVLNRHTPFAADKLARAMRGGGVFLTEQIHGRDAVEVNQHIEIRRPAALLRQNLENALPGLLLAGFTVVDAREGRGEMRFGDIGAVVRFALHHPEMFPGFSVAKCEKSLYSLHRHMETHGCLRTYARRYLIVARKGM